MQERRLRLDTFEELLGRSPHVPDDTALQAAMPQSACELFIRDAVQGLCPPYTPETLRRWLQTTQPNAWAIGASQGPAITPPPKHGEGTGQREAPQHRGKKRRKLMRTHAQEQKHQRQHITGARNHRGTTAIGGQQEQTPQR